MQPPRIGGDTVHELTSSTMTELGIQRLLAVQNVGHLSTVTASSPLDWAKLLWGLDGIGGTGFPGVFFGQRIMGTGPFLAAVSHSFRVSCLFLSLLGSLGVSWCLGLPVSVLCLYPCLYVYPARGNIMM